MFIGCDPDTHTTAFAAVNEQGQVMGAWIARSPEKLTEAAAVLDQCKRIRDLFFTHAEKLPLTLHDSCIAWAVENQEIAYTAKSGKSPRAMIPLAQCAGAAALLCSGLFENALGSLPKPQEWKGQTPKGIHQGRTYRQLGWEYTIFPRLKKPQMNGAYAVPNHPSDFLGRSQIKRGDWMHVGDAIGLALWVRQKYLTSSKVAKNRAATTG